MITPLQSRTQVVTGPGAPMVPALARIVERIHSACSA